MAKLHLCRGLWSRRQHDQFLTTLLPGGHDADCTCMLWVQLARRVTALRSPKQRRPRQSIAAIEQPSDAATAVQALPGGDTALAQPADAALLNVTEGVSGSAADGSHVTLQPSARDFIAADAARSGAGGTDEDSRQCGDAERQRSAPVATLPHPSGHASDTGACGGSRGVVGTDAAGDSGATGDVQQLEATAGQVSTVMEQMISCVHAAQSAASDADHLGSDSQVTNSEVSAEEPAAGCAEATAAQAGAAVVQEQAAEQDMAAAAEACGIASDEWTNEAEPSAADQLDEDMAEEHMAVDKMRAAADHTSDARRMAADAAEAPVAGAEPSAPLSAGIDSADVRTAAATVRCAYVQLVCSYECACS